jgi:hypothetical protein
MTPGPRNQDNPPVMAVVVGIHLIVLLVVLVVVLPDLGIKIYPQFNVGCT